LALRDAARNRSRTAPVVAAILAAVAGSVAVGTYLASNDAYDRARYEPSALAGTAVLGVYDAGQRAQLPEIATMLKQTLPAREVLTVASFDSFGTGPTGYVELATGCPLQTLQEPTQEQFTAAVKDLRCAGLSTRGGYLPQSLVGDAALLRAVTGVADPALDRVLAEGGVVVPGSVLVRDGTARAVVHPADEVNPGSGRTVGLPAAALPSGAPPMTVYSPAAAERIGLPVTDAGLVAVLDRLPTGQEQDRAQGALERLGLDAPLYVERGYTSDAGAALLALALASAILVLGASGIATGLAAADGRADLATLAAVGATPSVRRALAAFQSAVTAGLGTALGIVAGLVPAIGLLRALNSTAGRPPGFVQELRYPLVIPWEHLAITALAVPLLAALAAALLTRSRLPLVRRLA
jgi:putative ABC transport system permease protein